MKAKSETPIIGRLSDKQDESFIKTGFEELDKILGGGLARGRITELWGQEGTGKTHIVTKLMASLSKNEKVLYCDTEFALNKDRVAELGAKPENIDYVADSQLERVCELVNQSIGEYDVIIIDSLAMLTPLTIDTNEIGEINIGLFARLIKHWVVKLRPRLGKSRTALLVVNQHRKAIGLYAKTEPPGGMAWLHACDIRVQLTSNSGDKILKEGRQIGHHVIATTKKNKLATPYQSVKLKIVY